MAYMTHDDLKKMIEEKMKGKLPAWVRGYDLGAILPVNAVPGKLYHGVNLLLGMCMSEEKGSNIFATGRQWYELAKGLGYFADGGRPLFKRDAEGKKANGNEFVIAKQTKRMLKSQAEIDECPAMFREERGGKWYRRYSLFKGFTVYNLADIEPALADLVKANETKRDIGRAEEFEAFVDGLNLTVNLGRPSYRPGTDTIQMPPKESFESLQHWGGTLAHEISHWTGAAGRMEREGIMKHEGFGSDPYAEEEAIAEWFALIAVNQFGLIREGEVENHAAYIQGWTSRFANDPDLLTRTFREAEKAFEWAIEKSGVRIGVDSAAGEAQAEAA